MNETTETPAVDTAPPPIHNEELIGDESKTLNNTDAASTEENVSDVVSFGQKDLFVLLSKASSNKEGWMKSTKAMNIEGAGVVIQVTTQYRDQIAEALTFVQTAKVITDEDGTHRLVKR